MCALHIVTHARGHARTSAHILCAHGLRTTSASACTCPFASPYCCLCTTLFFTAANPRFCPQVHAHVYQHVCTHARCTRRHTCARPRLRPRLCPRACAHVCGTRRCARLSTRLRACLHSCPSAQLRDSRSNMPAYFLKKQLFGARRRRTPRVSTESEGGVGKVSVRPSDRHGSSAFAVGVLRG